MGKNTEQSRVRQGGTRVTRALTPLARISAIGRITLEKQYAKVDGMMVDSWSASAIIQVYNALNPPNQVMFSSKPVPVMANVAFQFVK